MKDVRAAIVIMVNKDGLAHAHIVDEERRRIADTDQLVGLLHRLIRHVEGDYPFKSGHIRHAYYLPKDTLDEATTRALEADGYKPAAI